MANSKAIDASVTTGSGLGLAVGEVTLVEHHPGWDPMAKELTREILAAVDSDDALVEHVGSTSVPGLPAKPVLDIAVGMVAPIDNDLVIERLENIGFEYQLDLGIYGGLFFTVSSAADVRVVHLHVVDINDFQWRWYLTFRNGLRADTELRDEYAQLKRAAAAANPADREAYTKAKFDWVLATVDRLDKQATSGS